MIQPVSDAGGNLWVSLSPHLRKGNQIISRKSKRRLGFLVSTMKGGGGACSYEDMSFVLIEQVELGNKALLVKRVQDSQHQLRLYVATGTATGRI